MKQTKNPQILTDTVDALEQESARRVVVEKLFVVRDFLRKEFQLILGYVQETRISHSGCLAVFRLDLLQSM